MKIKAPKVYIDRKPFRCIGINYHQKFVVILTDDGQKIRFISFSKDVVLAQPTFMVDKTGKEIFEYDILYNGGKRYVVWYHKSFGKFFGIDNKNRKLEANQFCLSKKLGNVLENVEQMYTMTEQKRLREIDKLKFPNKYILEENYE